MDIWQDSGFCAYNSCSSLSVSCLQLNLMKKWFCIIKLFVNPWTQKLAAPRRVDICTSCVLHVALAAWLLGNCNSYCSSCPWTWNCSLCHSTPHPSQPNQHCFLPQNTKYCFPVIEMVSLCALAYTFVSIIVSLCLPCFVLGIIAACMPTVTAEPCLFRKIIKISRAFRKYR